MLFDILLLSLLILLSFAFLKQKKQIEQLKKKVSEVDHIKQRSPQSEEFSLGLTKLNSEFPEHIPVDSLTGLPGREAFEDRLLQALNQSKRFEKSFAIVLLDIHEFHIINEAQGYEIGDKLLRDVAIRLKAVVRQIDTMTRYAGDTFIFLLPQLAMPETAAYVAQRLLDSIVQPFEIDGQQLFITASIGVAIFPSDGPDVKTLLKNANDALHQAKVHGKGRYQFYQQELHALGERELKINAFLTSNDALHKLLIYYQPHVNIKKDEVVCIQAIPFIPLSEKGLIPFSEFSKIAENCGKILEIGEWVLRNSILQFQKWHSEGFTPECLAINVTLRQIENPQFIYKVSQILQKLHMNPKQIIFEVAGDNLFSKTSSLEKAFAMLDQIGIQVAISVFALGQFALQKITKLPINYLKVDAKLIHGNNKKQDSEIIVHMIVNLAKDMRISIIADGVDNQKQKDLLEELGCEVMQGRLFGEPLPVKAMVK